MAPKLVEMVHVFLCVCLVISSVSGTPARRGKKQQQNSGPKTCPGFPGYCSESYPGQTCLVVCARGRNNVPECQEDGTWTDVPRCIEHEPGIEEQVPGICPGIPGYCSLDTPGGLCTFECPIGPKIRSTCTPDGTWDPYPTCEGDPRETQDGCNPCPGPFGGPRNRTAEGGAGGGSRGNNRQGGGGGASANRIGNGGNNKRPSSGGNNRNNNRGGNNRNNNRNQAGGGNNRNNNNNSHNKASNNRRNNNRNQSNGNRGSNRNQTNSNRGNNNQRKQQQNNHKSQGGGNRRQGGGGGGGSCPGDVLQACVDVCPGFSARIFSACVSGCAKRCPGRK